MSNMQTWGIDVMEWPSSSPDLNAIELVWAHLKMWLKTQAKPTTVPDLKRAMLYYWEQLLTVPLINRLIDHSMGQMVRVVEANGGPVID